MGETDRESEAPSKRESEGKPEDGSVGYSPCERTQRPMLAAEQIVGKIHSTQQVERSSCNADSCQCVTVHGMGERRRCMLHERRPLCSRGSGGPRPALSHGRRDGGAKNRPGATGTTSVWAFSLVSLPENWKTRRLRGRSSRSFRNPASTPLPPAATMGPAMIPYWEARLGCFAVRPAFHGRLPRRSRTAYQEKILRQAVG